ncbi:MAG: 2Fe-2S iron-sulfur cluster binding domain-containing protein [candidate division FCPU426 bacterium]
MTPFKIEFILSGKTVQCSPDQTILEAAQQAGIDIPFSCQGGTCHTCALKAEGQVDCEEMLALSSSEMEEGWRLTCVGRPLGDLKIFG